MPMHSREGMENCIVVFVALMLEAYKQWRFFCSIFVTRYFAFSVGSDYFWFENDVLLNVKTFLSIPLETIEQEGINNLCKKQISCKDVFVCSSLHSRDSIDDDDVDNMMEVNLEDA